MPKPKPKTSTTTTAATGKRQDAAMRRAVRAGMRLGLAQLTPLGEAPRSRLADIGDAVGDAITSRDVRALHAVIIILRRALRRAAVRASGGAS